EGFVGAAGLPRAHHTLAFGGPHVDGAIIGYPAPRIASRAHREPPDQPLVGAPLPSSFLDGHALDFNFVLGMTVTCGVGVVSASLGYFLDDIESADDSAKRCVVGLERRVLVHQEELAAVGVRSRVGLLESARLVGGSGEVLVVELVARAAAAGSRRVAALQHEQRAGGREPVAGGVVEELVRGEADE